MTQPKDEVWVLLPWSRVSENYEVSSGGRVRNYRTGRTSLPYKPSWDTLTFPSYADTSAW